MSSSLSPYTRFTLNNGTTIPALGLGVYKIPEGAQTENAVSWALEAGYRHIDTAAFYWNERSVGRAIKQSGIPRSEIFVTTKVMNLLSPEKAFYRSLENLDLGYIDLYLVHFPIPLLKRRAWKILEKIYKKGQVKAIGVSNYSAKQIQQLLEYAEVPPAVNQVEFSPFFYRKELLEYCQSKGIAVEAYSPLTRGHRLDDDVIGLLAAKYGKSSAQIMIRWSLQHGMIVLPKSSNREMIIENSKVIDFEISPEDMRKLDGLNENYHSLLH